MTKDLDERVRTLENKMYAAIAIAAIFGISGAFGARALQNAYEKIGRLEGETTTLEARVRTALSAIDGETQKDIGSLKLAVQAAISEESEKTMSDLNRRIDINKNLLSDTRRQIMTAFGNFSPASSPPNPVDAQLSNNDHLVWAHCLPGYFVTAAAARHNNVVPKEVDPKLLTGIQIECSKLTLAQ